MKLPSKAIRELLGLSKGAYGSLNEFQRVAFHDYEQWIKVSSNRNKFLFDGIYGVLGSLARLNFCSNLFYILKVDML